MLIYNIQYPMATVLRLGGRVLNSDRSLLDSPDLLAALLSKVVDRIAAVPAALLRMPFNMVTLFGRFNTGLFAAGLICILKNKSRSFFRAENIDADAVAVLFIICFVFFYVFFVDLDSARYVLPLYPVLPFLAGRLLSALFKTKPVYVILFSAVVLHSGYDNVMYLKNRVPEHIDRLSDRLIEKNITYAYSDYGTAYKVISESNEKVLVSPTLLHPTFHDRRPEYTAKVRSADENGYIVNTNIALNAAEQMESSLRSLGVSFQKERLYDYVIYYDISSRVYPEELNLTSRSESMGEVKCGL